MNLYACNSQLGFKQEDRGRRDDVRWPREAFLIWQPLLPYSGKINSQRMSCLPDTTSRERSKGIRVWVGQYRNKERMRGEGGGGRKGLTKHDIHPLGDRSAVRPIGKYGQIQRRLDQGEDGQLRGEVVLGVDSLRRYLAGAAGLGSCGDVDGVLGEVGGDRVPDRLVEAVVVAEVDVVAAETAIVFEDCIWAKRIRA